MFASDRDLLVVEPGLLREVAWLGQRPVSSASVAIGSGGTTVTDASGPFGSGGVDVGGVALLGEVPVEIVEVVSATEATVSLVRADPEGEPIGVVGVGATASMVVLTFAPQIAAVHSRVLRGLGLEPGLTEEGSEAPGEDRLENPGDLVDVEVAGALAMVYGAAAPLASAAMSSVIETKAVRHRDRYAALARAVVARIDLDGDGCADVVRRLGSASMVRG